MTAAQLATLKTEIQTDPLGLGYAGQSDAAIAALLNDPANAKAAAGPKVAQTLVPSHLILGAIVYSEIAAFTTNQLLLLLLIIGAGQVNAADANTRGILGGLFPAGATRANLLALSQRVGSRAEQLFGAGVAALTPDDCAAAFGRRP